MGSESIQLPRIDFSGLGPTSHGTEPWAAVRSQVMDALATYGCFEAVYPKVTPDLRHAVLDTFTEELFALPLDTKLRNFSNKPFHGYLGQVPYLPTYESLAIMDSEKLDGVHSFTTTMWPHGNPKFCEAMHAFSVELAELDAMVMRMVFESLGVEEFLKSVVDVTTYSLRLSEYGPPPKGEGEGEKLLGLIPHRDKNTTAIICQNKIDGLEMETKDGKWYPAAPSSDSVIVVAGDALRAWTNGRVYSPMHRILVGGKETRYSSILFSIPKDDTVIQAPPELIDGDHPPLFKPYDYESYIKYCFTEEGQKANHQLDEFCGLKKKEEAS